ncbi:MAG: amino acid permease [Eubacteriales bacterium]|jgi:APA family basic amino acid/polyamine antiporter|nr:amino acid permease [Eubacteriales bacterium]MDD3572625.1 amino acid permease [Eubacteriales bacterium]NLO14344.1 amino acid permease [Clostridiales bacterium]
MKDQLQKRYGLPMAIAMVIGIVIGSGVFFKAETVLKATGGNVSTGILAWAIVGVVMIICAYSFSILASRYEKVNGVVDYSEVMVGPRYGYYMGWFMTFIYQPSITAVLAWVSARYTCVLLGWDITGGACMTIAAFYLIASYAVNALSPRIGGKVQVSTTVIKLIPLAAMAVVGTIVGLAKGTLMQNFAAAAQTVTEGSTGLFTSVVAVAFAYEGWIIATSINAELRDAKKNLPRALVIGSLIVVAVYILYYIGLASVVPSDVLMQSGEQSARLAFSQVFGSVAGTLLFVFVIISCLGTLNGLMIGSIRGIYALAARNQGPKPEVFVSLDGKTNMPGNSAIIGLMFCMLWLAYFFGANLDGVKWFGAFSFDSSELPIITLYGAYIPVFLRMVKKERDLPVFKRVVMPILAILSCLFMVAAAIIGHGMAVVYYLVVFSVIMLAGTMFHRRADPVSGKK